MATVAELGRERFVSVTTYRRSGVAVATPVWAVADGGDLLVWTPADSGKVKRLRNDPRVELAPCSRRGAVADGAPRVAGTAVVETDAAAVRSVEVRLRREYGLEYRVVTTLERVVATLRRRRTPRVVLRISAD